MTSLLKIDNLYKSFGAVEATKNLSLDLKKGECHAIIGPNGAGKSTLIGQIVGEITQDSGTITFENHDLKGIPVEKRALMGLGRSFQITQLLMGFTVLENVALAVQATQGHSFSFFKNTQDDERLNAPAREALQRVGLLDKATIMVDDLSHGERRQLELAMVLALKPKVLLLDEPMAGMGSSDSLRVVEMLQSLKQDYTILLIEHDMDAVFKLADRISVLVGGHIILSDTPENVRHNKRVKDAYLGEETINA